MPSKNLSNWLTLRTDTRDNWGDLLNVATAWSAYGGMNPIWVYGGYVGEDGYGDVNENTIKEFCHTAWITGWLLALSRHEIVVWTCSSPDPCNNCHFPEGNWSIEYSYYVGEPRWVHY